MTKIQLAMFVYQRVRNKKLLFPNCDYIWTTANFNLVRINEVIFSAQF